jgi:transposase
VVDVQGKPVWQRIGCNMASGQGRPRNEILRRWYGGQSIRGVARDLKVARKTVKAVLEQHEQERQHGAVPPELKAPRARRASLVDPHVETIQDLLARYPKITVQRIWEELQPRGYTGGYSSYSRRQYLRFVEAQDMETTQRQHILAFQHLGGVPATCLYDGMKVVVSRYEDEQPIYNPRFLAFATHYGYRPVACRPRRPQTKGKVERPFQYVESSLLGGREFRSLEHLNEVTAWWLENVADVRVHGQTRRRPVDLHAEELPHLIPLPEQPYEVAEVVYRTVDEEGFVAYGQNRYSVPWSATRPGQLLPVKITEQTVIIYGPHLEELARHARYPATVTHQDRQLPAHRPPRDQQRRRELLQQRYAQLGEGAGKFLDGLLQSQRHGWQQAEKVLALLATYRPADFQAALERAVRYGAFSLSAVQRILAVQAQPKSCLEQLAEQATEQLPDTLRTPATPPRPPADYQPLLFPEIDNHDEEPPALPPVDEQTAEDGRVPATGVPGTGEPGLSNVQNTSNERRVWAYPFRFRHVRTPVPWPGSSGRRCRPRLMDRPHSLWRDRLVDDYLSGPVLAQCLRCRLESVAVDRLRSNVHYRLWKRGLARQIVFPSICTVGSKERTGRAR